MKEIDKLSYPLCLSLLSRDSAKYEAFYEIAYRVIHDGKTLLDYDRLYTLWKACRACSDFGGIAVEVGVYKGGSLYFIASALQRLHGSEVSVLGFDTFSGHPDIVCKRDNYHKPGMFGDNSLTDVAEYLAPFHLTHIYQGEFPRETGRCLPPDEPIGLVHLDTDLYQSIFDSLLLCWPDVLVGGMVVIDDFKGKKTKGVDIAVFDYFKRRKDVTFERTHSEQLIAIKR